MPFVLDTSFLIDLQQGTTAARACLEGLLAERGSLLIPPPVLAEYLEGSKDPAADLDLLQRSAHLDVLTPGDAIRAADIAREQRRRGAYAGRVDTLIQAYAESREALIVTADQRAFPDGRARLYRT